MALDEQRPRRVDGMLLDEARQRPLGLRSNYRGNVGRHDVHDVDGRLEVATQGRGVDQRQLGVRAAAHGSQDARHVLDAALLDDRDVARRVAHDLVDRGREDSVRLALAARPTAPAEDDQIGLVLRSQLDDALCRPATDPDDRPQLNSGRRELEHSLQQAARLARLGGTLRKRHALGHLDDAQRGEDAAVRDQRGADLDQVGCGARVGERNQDPLRQLGLHQSALCQRSTRYGLASSKARAWRSTKASA